MRKAENVNAPWLGGWMIGAAAGLVAFAALTIIGEFDLTPAVVIGAVVAVLAGLILGMPWGAGDGAGDRVRFARAVSPPAAADASRPAEPKPEPVSAAGVSAPRSDASKPAAKPGTKAKPKPKLAKPAGPVRLTAPRNGKTPGLPRATRKHGREFINIPDADFGHPQTTHTKSYFNEDLVRK